MVIFGAAKHLVATLEAEVEWLRDQWAHERRRADSAMETLLMLKQHVALGPPLQDRLAPTPPEDSQTLEELGAMGEVPHA